MNAKISLALFGTYNFTGGSILLYGTDIEGFSLLEVGGNGNQCPL